MKITEQTTLGELTIYLAMLGCPFITLMRGVSVGERYAIVHDPAKGSFYGTGITEATALEAAISGLRRALLPEPLRTMLETPAPELPVSGQLPSEHTIRRISGEGQPFKYDCDCGAVGSWTEMTDENHEALRAKARAVEPCHGCMHVRADHPNDSGCQSWHANADGESEHDQYDRATGDLGRPLLLENDPPEEAYEGSFCEAADNEGARIAAADREGGEE